MLLSGVIGFAGWCIAVVHTAEAGAVSIVFGCFDISEFAILASFVVMMVLGLAVAIKEIKKDSE